MRNPWIPLPVPGIPSLPDNIPSQEFLVSDLIEITESLVARVQGI